MLVQGNAVFAMEVFQTRLSGMLREFIRENIYVLSFLNILLISFSFFFFFRTTDSFSFLTSFLHLLQ